MKVSIYLSKQSDIENPTLQQRREIREKGCGRGIIICTAESLVELTKFSNFVDSNRIHLELNLEFNSKFSTIF